MRARAKDPRKPHEMTKAESAWMNHEFFTQGFASRKYEAITLRIGKTRYTPDWSGVCVHSGEMVFFEIKPAGHRAVFTDAARLKLQMFVDGFPEYRFFVCWPKSKKYGGGWEIKEY